MEGEIYPYRSTLQISEEHLFFNEGMIKIFKIDYYIYNLQ